MKARYELLGSGTPETNHRNIEKETKKELKRIAKNYDVTLEPDTEGVTDYLHIQSFATQNNSFVNFQKLGSVRRVLNS